MTEYDLGKVVGDDGEAGNGIASITKTGTSGLVDTYTITYDDGTTTTFTVTNGSDASVTIQTSWGSTTSDSKVPSEKLTKDTLDTKIAKSSTTGLVKNDGSIMTSGTGSTNYAAGNHSHSGYVSATKVTSWSGTVSDSNVPSEKLVKNSLDDKVSKSSTTGLLKNDGTVMASGTGSSNWAVGNHTHSAYVNPTKVTSWSSTPSDSNVASEKLIKDTLDAKQATLVSGTNIKTVNNESLLGSGNITIQGGSSVDIVTAWESTPSDSKVPSENLVYTSLATKVDMVAESTNTFYEDDSSNGHIYLFDSHLDYNTSNNKIKYGSYELATLNDIPSLANYVQTSSTAGLLKNDGTVMTSGTGSTNYSAGNHTHGNLTSDGKVGSNANYIIITGTGGAITSTQKLGNITYDGKIGTTSGKPVITTTGGTVTTGSFGSTSGTFAEGNHTHSNYISTSSTTGLVKNDGSIMTSGTGSTNYAAGNHTHSGYVSATKVTSWSSTTSDSNVPSEKLVKDSLDDIEDLIGDAIAYINQ